MADLTTLLHDEIDAQEELREAVRLKVKELREQLPQIAQQTDNLGDIFEIVAGLLGDDLAEETTRAVRIGFEFAKKRAARGR